MSMRVRIRSLAVAVAVLGAAGLAHADWLVTRDGAWVETKGPWKVDGRRIVFTSPTGTLSALRAEDVDLDASAALTAEKAEEARRAAEPKVEEKKTPVLVLTEKELPPSAVEEEEEAGATAATAGGSGLEVASWEKVQNPTSDTLEVFGTVKNTGKVNITSPSMLVMIYGQDGGLLASNEGIINAGMIAPGGSANFRVSFPGVPDFAAVKFDVQGRGFRVQPGAEETPAEEGGETEEPSPDETGG